MIAIDVKDRMVNSSMPVDNMNEEDFSASCCNCKHYHVTWDKDFPWRCKAMGFKSRTYPAQGGQGCLRRDCQLFERKGSRSN